MATVILTFLLKYGFLGASLYQLYLFDQHLFYAALFFCASYGLRLEVKFK